MFNPKSWQMFSPTARKLILESPHRQLLVRHTKVGDDVIFSHAKEGFEVYNVWHKEPAESKKPLWNEVKLWVKDTGPYKAGDLTCDCADWRYNKPCEHTKRVASLLTEGLVKQAFGVRS